MLDFGWAEFLLIAAVAVFVIGPNEIPAIMRTLGQMVRRIQYIKFAFSQQFEDFMRENDLNELRNEAMQRGDDTKISVDDEKYADEDSVQERDADAA